MGWFLNYTVPGWGKDWSGEPARDWTSPDLYIELARAMERARFDYMMLEDGSFIPDAYQGTAEYYLAKAAHAPKHEPAILVPLLMQATRHLGVIMTIATPYYPPFAAARLMASLDHLSNGRAGINLVTAHNVRTAQNFGRDEHYEHDLRYEMADEWIDLVNQLWTSWQPDAVIADYESGIYADHAKVNAVNFEGRFYKSRGPLNTIPSPQGRPVVCQAGETHDEAVAKKKRIDATTVEDVLARISWTSGIDFSQFDLDAPLPTINTDAASSTTLGMLQGSDPTTTLREIAQRPVRLGSLEVSGTVDEVASVMDEAMQEVGGDGFLIAGQLSRRYISEVADGLAPVLRRRGLIRSEYTGATLRDNLREF
ncbi:LLM class flavin-dependent oxidoreductase [Cryobacterium sp.]|uniref:LLM class flavin-dependent oxidoreductase n=1 Tax=Cryobacterium sp. TaxID=1926290 RepID=UPI0026372A35|nr:LLM class flavin-dependent oxidoreductase [Cryobacterium sp.]